MKRKSFLSLIIVCILAIFGSAFAACNVNDGGNSGSGNNGGSTVVAVESVTLSSSELELKEGETGILLFTIKPADATDKSVSWLSSNDDVATVSKGTVTAVAAGTAIITVKTGNGKTDTCNVTVTELAPPPGGTWVMFDLNGHGNSAPQPSKITDGKAAKPADPTDSDYDFGGWFEDKECTGIAVDFSTKTFNGNQVLYAKWTVKQATDPENPNPPVDPDPEKPEHTAHTYIYTDLNETSHKKTCSGCTEINITEAHVYDNEQDTECNLCKHIRTVETEKPDPNPPVVDPDPEKPEHTAHTYVYTDLNETSHKKTCSGCTEINITEAHVYDNEQDTECNLCKHIRKIETENPNPPVDPEPTKYTVTFISNGKTVDTQEVIKGQKAVQPNEVTNDGYTLTGWALIEAGTDLYEFEQAVESDLTLYAVWKKNETPVTPPDEKSPITYSYSGNECAAFEWTESDAENARVEYKKSTESSYTAVDNQLIRDKGNGTARVDIVGLAGGVKYDFKITTSENKSYFKTDVAISAYDRSGYAHFGKTDGVGAYKDDGTLKDKAVVVYVTEATKNTVTAKIGSKTYTGIVSILQNAGTSTPLVVRIIGTVGAATWNKLVENGDKALTPDKVVGVNGTKLVDYYNINRSTYNSSTKKYEGGTDKDLLQDTLIKDGFNSLNETVYSELKGLSSKIKYNASKDEFDSCWNDCSVSGVKNVTVEGIGEDARIFQWGITFKSCSSIEVRNLTFEDYTEDACSFEGGKSENTTSLSNFKTKNFWIHHNTFEEGVNYWDVCNEQDKHDGDGSTDFKYLSNVTISYNVYNKTHKTGLIGGANDQHTANVTFHHNYYNGCKSRLPLARQANMHMYNNYYNGTTSTDISLRANAYALVENCYFSSTKSVNIELQYDKTNGNGAAKVVGCVFAKKNTVLASGVSSSNLYVGNDRGATVNNTNSYSTTFDTDPDLFYYKNGKSDVTEMLTAEQVKTEIPKVAGVQQRGSGTISGGSTSGGDNEGGNTGGDSGNTGGEQTKSGTVIIFSSGAKTLVDGELSNTLTGVTVTVSDTTSVKSNKFVYNGVEYNNSYKLDSKGEVTVRLAETKEVTFCYYEYGNKTNPQISIGGVTYGGGDGTTDSYGRYFTVKVTLQADTDYKIVRLNGIEIDLCYMLIG